MLNPSNTLSSLKVNEVRAARDNKFGHLLINVYIAKSQGLCLKTLIGCFVFRHYVMSKLSRYIYNLNLIGCLSKLNNM